MFDDGVADGLLRRERINGKDGSASQLRMTAMSVVKTRLLIRLPLMTMPLAWRISGGAHSI